MPVPSAITDLSQTAGSNSPAGSESPNTADDYFRAHASFIAQLRDGKNFADPTSLASAGTTDIGAENSMFVQITGTTTITSFGTNYNGPRFLRFSGALTLTHNATTLNLPGGANITTAAGDTCIAIPNSTPNGWNVVQFQRASGAVFGAMTTARILGRTTAGTGDVEELTAATVTSTFVNAATDTTAGKVELATDAEAQTGTSTSVVLTPANMKAAQIQLATAVASTSGTAIDFTGIPTVAKRVTVMFDQVSLSGTSAFLVQLGDSGGVETTGYNSTVINDNGTTSTNATTGFQLANTGIAATALWRGILFLQKIDGNKWVGTSILTRDGGAMYSSGRKELSATLDRVRITTVNGTDTFDAGLVNISWE